MTNAHALQPACCHLPTTHLHEAIEGIKVSKQRFELKRKLSEVATTVLNCFKEQTEIRLTTGKIIEQIGLPSRTIIYALNTLLEHQLIQKYAQGTGVQYQLTF